MEIAKAEIKYAIPCGVCGNPIDLNEWEVRHTTFRLCPECIEAIKWAKKQRTQKECLCKTFVDNVKKAIENTED